MARQVFFESAELVFSIETKDGSRSSFSTSTGWTKREWKQGSDVSGSEAYEKMESLGKSIKRALGQYEDSAKDFEVRLVSEPRCEHCGSRWTEKSSDYNGGCCDADQSAEDERETNRANAADPTEHATT